MKRNIDLLHGNILTSLTELAVPIMATSMVQTAYSLTDMAWIGMVGSDAVAAVGAMSGLGRTMEASVITIILTALRIPMAIVLGTTALGLDGVWWALTISSIIKGIVFFIYYQRIMRRWNVR